MQALLTPAWQAGVALIGALMLLLAQRAQVKHKGEDAGERGGELAKVV